MHRSFAVPSSILLAATFICAAQPAVAQEESGAERHFSAGFGLLRLQDDFGLGVLVGTPFFASDSVRLTLGGGGAFYPHDVSADGQEQWTPYGHARLVVEGGSRVRGTPIRLYGVGGPVVLFLPDRLTDTNVRFGGWGGFGFEFLTRDEDGSDGGTSYYLELGGIGTGATADKVPGKPIFANGFLINVGFRGYL